ncbi:MAG: hypothetical protein QOJ06_1620 [Pseudonocardiales bacterium]|jgi:hypothetical protein|nr:hypothetical protein [Pseudonocardiales bacterium]
MAMSSDVPHPTATSMVLITSVSGSMAAQQGYLRADVIAWSAGHEPVGRALARSLPPLVALIAAVL